MPISSSVSLSEGRIAAMTISRIAKRSSVMISPAKTVAKMRGECLSLKATRETMSTQMQRQQRMIKAI